MYYLDKTRVNAGHTKEKVWEDATVSSREDAFRKGLTSGLCAPSGKGGRLIVLHARSENGSWMGHLSFSGRKRVLPVTTTVKWIAHALRDGSKNNFYQTLSHRA